MLKKTLSVVLILSIIALTVCGCKNKNNAETETTTATTTTTTTTEATTIPINIKEKYPLNFNKFTGFDDISEEEMIEQLNENIAHFNKETQELLMYNFREMLGNCDILTNALRICGFPDTKQFIYERYVKPLKDIKYIYYQDTGNKELDAKFENYGGSFYSPEDNAIYIGAQLGRDEDAMNAVIKEEFMHAGQPDFYDKKHENYDLCDYWILYEGEDNILSTVLTYGCINNEPSYFFREKDEHMYANYGIGNGYYSLATKYYVYLCSLLGFSLVNDFINGDITSETVGKIITENYEIDGETFYKDLKQSLGYASAYNTEQGWEEYYNTEKRYWKCLEKRFDTLKTKEEIEAFFDLYRYINIQFGFNYFDIDDSQIETLHDYVYTENTKEKFLLTEFDNKLFNKIEEIGTFKKISEDKKIRRKIFDSLVRVKIEDYRNELIFPITVLDAKIELDESNNILKVRSNKRSFSVNIQTGKAKKIG